MISVNEAESLILKNIESNKSQVIYAQELHKHNRLILREEIYATRDQPPFDRVAMDGIAINFEHRDRSNYIFSIEDVQRAGEAQKTLKDLHKCLEVMTGAPLPVNCDCVIPYEDVEIKENQAVISSQLKISQMQNIHRKGSDYTTGDYLSAGNKIIHSSLSGIIVSQGKTEVEVSAPVKIAIISTGDELVELNEKPQSHQIYRSNPYALQQELSSFGFSETSLFHFRDEKDKVFDGFKKILDSFSVVIISGGVSKGKFDYVPTVLEDLQVQKIFHRVNQKPGKPFWFGKGGAGQVVFGLPGNPVSCLVNLRRYVIPALLFSCGLETAELQKKYAVLEEDLEIRKGRTFFKLVEIAYQKDGTISAKPIKSNGSGDFYSLGKSSGFIELPGAKTTYKKGEAFPIFMWGQY